MDPLNFEEIQPKRNWFSLTQQWEYIRSIYLQTSFAKAQEAEYKILSRLQFFSRAASGQQSSSPSLLPEVVARVGDVDIGDGRYIHTL
ncbi:hypothetical protein EV182_002104, partial [Spiromyces aspiralis]